MIGRSVALCAVVAMAAVAALPVSASAQRVSALAGQLDNYSHFRESADRKALPGASAADSSRRRVFWTRVATGSLGWFLGVVAGAFIAADVLPQHDCRCDDPGLDQALYGAFAGSVVGSAAGAAHFSLGNSCRYMGRFGRGLIGSLAGTVIAAAVTIPVYSPAAIITFPLGASSGAALAIGGC